MTCLNTFLAMSSKTKQVSSRRRLGATMKTPSPAQPVTAQRDSQVSCRHFAVEKFNIRKELEIQKSSDESTHFNSTDTDGSGSSLRSEVKGQPLTSPTTSTSTWNSTEGSQGQSKIDDLELL